MDLSHLFPDRATPAAARPAVSLDISPGHCLPVLHDAIFRRDENAYFRLVEYGADPMVRLPPIEHDDFFDEDWSTYRPEDGLLFLAVERCCARVVEDLLVRGEDPNQLRNGFRTPLLCWVLSDTERRSTAEMANWEATGEVLLRHGANAEGPVEGLGRDGAAVSILDFLEDRRDEHGPKIDWLRACVQRHGLQGKTPQVARVSRRRF